LLPQQITPTNKDTERRESKLKWRQQHLSGRRNTPLLVFPLSLCVWCEVRIRGSEHSNSSTDKNERMKTRPYGCLLCSPPPPPPHIYNQLCYRLSLSIHPTSLPHFLSRNNLVEHTDK
jgi:hypothetical protein